MDFNIGAVQRQRPLYPQQPNIPGAVPPAQLHGVGQVMQGMPPVAMLAPYQQDAGARALTLIQQLQSDLRERDNLIAQLHELEGEIQRDQAVVLNVSLGLASYGQQPYSTPQQQQPHFPQQQQVPQQQEIPQQLHDPQQPQQLRAPQPEHAPQQTHPQHLLHAQEQPRQSPPQARQGPLELQPEFQPAQLESLPIDDSDAGLPPFDDSDTGLPSSSEPVASSSQEVGSSARKRSKRRASGGVDSERAPKRRRAQAANPTLKSALRGAPASAIDAFMDLDRYVTGSVNRYLLQDGAQIEFTRYVRRLEKWVDLVARRGGEAMPILMFGFNQLARSYRSAYSAKNDDRVSYIVNATLRADTLESFRALWRESELQYKGDGKALRHWTSLRNAVSAKPNCLTSEEIASARLPAPVAPVVLAIGPNAVDVNAVELASYRQQLSNMPFDWKGSLDKLGERVCEPSVTTGTTTTTTTTNTNAGDHDV